MLLRRALSIFIVLAAVAPAVAFADTPHPALSPDPLPTYSNTPFSVQADFTVGITDFVAASVAVTNASISTPTMLGINGKHYTFTVTPTIEGAVSVGIPAGVVHADDGSGTGNTVSNTLNTLFDVTAPVLSLFSTTTTSADPVFYIATSSEPIVGFDASDIAVTNGTVINFVAASSTEYHFFVTGFTDGLTTLSVAPSTFADAAGNTNTAAASAQYGFFNLPTATISISNLPTPPVFSPGNTVEVAVLFSEAIDASSTPVLAISGTDALASTSLNRVDATHYTYSYEAKNDGTDTLSVGGALDLAGNPMVPAGTSVSILRPAQTPAIQGGGGGGGSGGGAAPSAAAAPAASGGEVLGAESYKFTSYLVRGSRGDEVQNLQGLLIAAGFLAEDSLSSYFGPATQKAVIAYQKAHGLAQTGTVGPATRALLNKNIPAPSAAAPAAALPTKQKSTLSQVQVDAIVALVKAFGTDAKTVANVIAALK